MATRLGGSRMTAAWKSLESKCRNCKTIFLHTQEHVYAGCCSYKCFRAIQRKQEERDEKKRGEKLRICTERSALRRIEECKERIGYYENVSKDQSKDKKTRDSSRRMKNEWKRKLAEAEITLRSIRSWEDG